MPLSSGVTCAQKRASLCTHFVPSSLKQLKSTVGDHLNGDPVGSIKIAQNQSNQSRKKTPVEQILGLRQGIIPVLRQLAINHSALELRGELRLLLLVLLQFKSRHPKNIPFGLISLKVTLKNHSKKFKVRNGRDQGWKVNKSGRLPHLLPGCLLLSTCLCVLAEGVIHLLWHLTG